MSVVVYNFEKLSRALDRIAELTDFFDNAPCMYSLLLSSLFLRPFCLFCFAFLRFVTYVMFAVNMGVVELRNNDTIFMLYGNKAVASHIGETTNVLIENHMVPPGARDHFARMYKVNESTGDS